MRIVPISAAGLVAAVLLCASTGNRKVTENQLSPTADTSITLNGHAVTIEYNAPSARERKVEGGLIPYDVVWRLGADSATTLTAGTDLTIGGLKVPKGVYTLYVLAGESGWKLIVNKQTGQWGTDYSQEKDLGRVDLKLSKLSQPAEKLKITLQPEGSGAVLEIVWGNTRAVAPVKAG